MFHTTLHKTYTVFRLNLLVIVVQISSLSSDPYYIRRGPYVKKKVNSPYKTTSRRSNIKG